MMTAGNDATIAGAQIVINYSVPTNYSFWWMRPRRKSQVGRPVFDPVALLVNPSVSGNTTFYAQYDALSLLQRSRCRGVLLAP